MRYIKKYWWLAIVIALAVYIFVLNREINRLSGANRLQAVELSTLNGSVAVYKSKIGELTYKLASVEIERGNLKQALDIAGVDIKVLRADNINWRKLNSVLTLELEASGNVETTIRDTFRIENTDTIYYSAVDDWTNNYLSLFNAKVETKKLFFDYGYKTGINIFPEATKKGTVVTVKLSDPKASITSANSITVVNKTKWYEKPWPWGLAGFAGGILIAK